MSIGIVLVVAEFIPVFPGSVAYRSVLDDGRSTSEPSWDGVVSAHEAGVEAHDLYALKDGVLHLRCQTTRTAMILVTGVSFTYWPLEALAAFRAEHPDLEGYWPDPTAPNAGVDWIPISEESGSGRPCLSPAASGWRSAATPPLPTCLLGVQMARGRSAEPSGGRA